MNKDKLVQIGRIILSFLFLFSGISKLLSMPFFDDMVMEFLIGPEYFDHPKAMWWTQLFTRIMVAGELVIGVALLQAKWFKKWVLPVMMIILALFTVHLFYEGIANPNGFIEGNCGCFGDVLPMTILESILKNVVAMVIGVFVWMWYDKSGKQKFASWVGPTMLGLVTLFTLGFGIKSIDNDVSTENPIVEASDSSSILSSDTLEITNDIEGDSTSENDPVETDDVNTNETKAPSKKTEDIVAPAEGGGMKDADDPNVDNDDTDDAPSDMVVEPNQHTINLLSKFNSFSDGSKIDFESGTSLVCLFSMSCSHCQEVYKEMCELSDQLPKTYLINYGVEFEQAYFFKQAGDCKHPHNLTNNFTDFKRALEGSTYPRILVIKNGRIANQWDVDTYSRKSFMAFFGMKEPEKKSNGGLELETGDSPW